MTIRTIALLCALQTGISVCAFGQALPKSPTDECTVPTIDATSETYKKEKVKQPKATADLPSVVRTVEQALKCYQQITGDDPLQPKGLPKLSSVSMDFKTTTGVTGGFSFSIFIFKVGASSEKDVTDDLTFTYSVPKSTPLRGAFNKPTPPPLYEELVKDVQAAARAAQTQSAVLGKPLSSVKITISYGVKKDVNASLSVPVQLVTIGGNGDYNKNNVQTLTLTFGAA